MRVAAEFSNEHSHASTVMRRALSWTRRSPAPEKKPPSMALAAQVGAGTYKKLGDEAPFSTEFTSKSGVLFSRKLSFGRKPKGVQASAFGVDGVLEPKIGMLPGGTGIISQALRLPK